MARLRCCRRGGVRSNRGKGGRYSKCLYLSVCLCLSVCVCMSTPKGRIQKLNEILEILEKNEGKMKFKALYGSLALRYGTTEQTMWSYLNALKAGGKIDYSTVVIKTHDFDVWLLNYDIFNPVTITRKDGTKVTVGQKTREALNKPILEEHNTKN